MALAPGINILCEKNTPRKTEEAKCNIRRAGIKDDMQREPWLDDKITKWMFVARADPSKGQVPGLLAFVDYLNRDPTSVLWFFIQYHGDDLPAHAEYLILKLLIEERSEERAKLEKKLQRVLAKLDECTEIIQVLKEVNDKICSALPVGMWLRDHVQIFTNLSTELADFASLAHGHIVLSIREGYNVVISEMARHILPVVANDYPPFRDRIISGKQGGWLVELSDYVLQTPKASFLRDYISGRREVITYVTDIASKLHFIKSNPSHARQVAAELNNWINKDGHLLRYHMDRLAFALASNSEMQGCKIATEVARRVLHTLRKQQNPLENLKEVLPSVDTLKKATLHTGIGLNQPIVPCANC
jgi:glycosyltransferase involved in cell wall biosynthesis